MHKNFRILAIEAIAASMLLASLSHNPSLAETYDPGVVHDVDLLENGNLLVSEGGIPGETDSGVFEIDRDGNIVWSYTTGLAWTHNADIQPDSSIVISDTGNDRVIIVERDGTVIWDTDDIILDDGSELDYPNDANLLDNGNVLITDRDNHRVLEIGLDGAIVWQFGDTGIPGSGPLRLNGPHNADRLSSGNTIVADSNNDRILEISPGGSVVWSYAGGLHWPRDADRLASGNTLVNDSSNHHIIEVTPGGSIVWEYEVLDMSYDSDRLDSGNTLLSDGGSIREITSSGEVVWSYPATYETEIVEGYFVTAPTGNLLWTKIIQPRADLYPGEIFPAIVCMTGGLGNGETGNQHVADNGVIEFHFNAEGRGVIHPSDGSEDYNGFIHQDDLKAVIEFALARENVDIQNVGVVTSSYGITAGAGCLGRYPALPVKYLIDLEGPSDSFVTCKEPWSLDDDPSNDMHENTHEIFGHWSIYRDPSEENVAWWTEREATRYIGDITCRYLRIQAEWDHAQPPNALWPEFDYPPLWYQCKHAIDLVNLATLGSAPWTRVNGLELGNDINTTYAYGDPPEYYSGRMANHPGMTEDVILEMVAMLPLATGVDEGPVDAALQLLVIYPNPFNPSTNIQYELSETGPVDLVICDVSGRMIRRLESVARIDAGSHTTVWNGRDERGRPVASGIYFVRLTTERQTATRKLVLLK